MNYHHWSALFRGYDLTLRHNQLILVLTAVGAGSGFLVAQSGVGPATIQAIVAGIAVFMAGALAKELVPDHPLAALIAAMLALPIAWLAPLSSAVALFWLLGSLRFLNRTTGLRPKWTDLAVLLIITGLLGWQVTPLFGILMGVLLTMNSVLPDSQQSHVILGVVIIIGSSIWFLISDQPTDQASLWLVVCLIAITLGFMAVILNSYHTQAVTDATGEILVPSRIQAGQAFGLSAGLFLASWQGEAGVILLASLWAAVLGAFIHYLMFARLRRSAVTL